jgi:hypothetical protein
VYAVEVGPRRSSATVEVSVAGGSYEIATRSRAVDTLLVLSRSRLATQSISTVTRTGAATIRATTEVDAATRLPVGTNVPSIPMLELAELAHKLRGFDFTDRNTIPIQLLSTGPEEESSFELGVKLARNETLAVEGRQLDTHKLELVFSASGIVGMLGRLAPKTLFWFSVEAPHYLVRYQGGGGPPGTPTQSWELRDYSGW